MIAPAVSSSTVHAEDVSVSDDDDTEREIDGMVAAGDESADVAHPAVLGTQPMPSAPEIQSLLSGLTVQRTDRGGLLIEAPPETAATLAALFSGIGQLLQAGAIPTGMGDDPVAPRSTLRPNLASTSER